MHNHHSSLSEPYKLIMRGERSNHYVVAAAEEAPLNIMMPIYAGVELDGGIMRYHRSLGFFSVLLHFDFSILIRDIFVTFFSERQVPRWR
jgi:hypothetical protein